MKHKTKEEVLKDVTSFEVDTITAKAVPALIVFVVFYLILNNIIYAAILTAILFGLAYYYMPTPKKEETKK
jgi:hypothetical protein